MATVTICSGFGAQQNKVSLFPLFPYLFPMMYSVYKLNKQGDNTHSWDPIDCSLIGSSVHGILQARILEWVAISLDCVDHNKLWKIFIKRWEYQTTYLPPEKSVCRSRSNRTGHGKTDWFQIVKGVCQGYTLSPCLFNSYAEDIMRNAGLEEVQAGIKIAGRNINNLRYADDTTLMAESEEELKSLLVKVTD